MKPLQVWLPLFGSSLADPAFERDAQRAFASWRGESRIWLLPEFTKVVRWQEGPTVYMAGVPSERLNRIDICHVGKNNHREADSSPSLRRSPAHGPRLAGWFALDRLRVAGSASQDSQDAEGCVPGRLPSFIPESLFPKSFLSPPPWSSSCSFA